MHVAVEFSWRYRGEVHRDGRLRFPDVPDAPGIYRLDFGQRVYLGETDRLRRRFQHYRNPGPTQRTNQRLNALMLQLLADERAIEVSTATEATIEIDGQRGRLDLGSRPARLLVENAALMAAVTTGQAVENL